MIVSIIYMHQNSKEKFMSMLHTTFYRCNTSGTIIRANPNLKYFGEFGPRVWIMKIKITNTRESFEYFNIIIKKSCPCYILLLI
jgi:hypothetical protein